MTDELTSEKMPEAQTGPTLFIWDQMIQEQGDPIATIEPPTPLPAFVEELDQGSVVDGVDTAVFLPGSTGRSPIPMPTPKTTPATNWPKLPD